MSLKIGDKVSVFWYTGDKNSSGNNLGTVLDILPYRGPFDFIECIAKINAPECKKGYTHMSIEKNITIAA